MLMGVILFVFGLAIGSFLNVVILRYDGERFLWSAEVLGGRSHCMHCKKTLAWYELIPVVSYLIQGGRCRTCKTLLSPQYPIVEFLSGLIFVAIPLRLPGLFFSGAASAAAAIGPGDATMWALSAFWIVAFELLLVMSVIDIRMSIIPDELNTTLLVVALGFAIFLASPAGQAVGAAASADGSLLGPFGAIFGVFGNVLLDRLFGALFAGGLFWFLVWVTPYVFHKEGMGMGDVKLAVPLGVFLGWPDIALAIAAAFVIGAVGGLIAIAFGKRTMEGTVPFGPFFAIGVATVFFFGAPLMSAYFSALGIG